MACCSTCAMGDVNSNPGKMGSGDLVKVLLVIVVSAGAAVGLAMLDRKLERRAIRRYWEPEIRKTQEIPTRTMKELVDE